MNRPVEGAPAIFSVKAKTRKSARSAHSSHLDRLAETARIHTDRGREARTSRWASRSRRATRDSGTRSIAASSASEQGLPSPQPYRRSRSDFASSEGGPIRVRQRSGPSTGLAHRASRSEGSSIETERCRAAARRDGIDSTAGAIARSTASDSTPRSERLGPLRVAGSKRSSTSARVRRPRSSSVRISATERESNGPPSACSIRATTIGSRRRATRRRIASAQRSRHSTSSSEDSRGARPVSLPLASPRSHASTARSVSASVSKPRGVFTAAISSSSTTASSGNH